VTTESGEALLDLLARWRKSGGRFAHLTAVDRHVDDRDAAIFLKHDVHDLDVDGLVAFAAREAELRIVGTYFFMPPEHPRTRKAYGFSDQIRAMKAVAASGHELGLHIDPYFLIAEENKSLDVILKDMLATFAQHGVTFRIGNMHGNSRHTHPDLDGYGTSFDLFDEVARQPDYPTLARVPAESAAIIRANRTSLVGLGFTHWADMPIWSAKHGFVATNFLTDNRFGKDGSYELILDAQTRGAYLLCEAQRPGSRNRIDGVTVEVSGAEKDFSAPVHERIMLTDGALAARFGEARRIMPLLVLLHPEFYC
jgi:hypothetical protein